MFTELVQLRKQRKISTGFNVDDLQQLKMLAGISNRALMHEYKIGTPENISHTASEKAELMRKHKIKPGTDAWFKLWFSLPYLTGEKPV